MLPLEESPSSAADNTGSTIASLPNALESAEPPTPLRSSTSRTSLNVGSNSTDTMSSTPTKVLTSTASGSPSPLPSMLTSNSWKPAGLFHGPNAATAKYVSESLANSGSPADSNDW